ncbi:hypothetical protein BC628DRAFT_1307644, partial [Trametes gibbosa]
VCRFDYPFACRRTAGMGFDSKGRIRFEPQRNDTLLNPHNRAMIFAMQANIDIKPVLSEQAALSYIAKYVSKVESSAPQFPALLAGIFLRGGDNQRTWQDVFNECCESHPQHPKDTLQSWAQENTAADPEVDENEEINPDLAQLDEADWQRWDNQQRILDRFINEYMAIIGGEENTHLKLKLNIDGTAGCGKTYLIRAICQELRRLSTEHGHADPRSNTTPDEQASFNDSVCLFTKTDTVHEANSRKLIALNNPCARIVAKHNGGPEAAKATTEDTAGLEATLVLSRGAKVMITRNIWQQHGACLLLRHGRSS